ncbi:hypothetical protein SALBM135S_09107 [Streptomyces alboniger]
MAAALVLAALRSPFKRPDAGARVPQGRVTRTPALDQGHLTAYRDLCGFDPRQAALPLTYPHVLAFGATTRVLTAPDFPLPLLGLVHTSVEISRHRDLNPADLADGRTELGVRVEGLREHRRGTEATLVTEARVRGDLVWTSSSTYLARHRTRGTTADSAREPHAPREPAATPGATWKLPPDLGRRYAAVSGDRNPIHLYPLTARLFGFPRAIAHGMWTVARCLAEQGTRGGPVHVRAEFKAPVLLPATVTYRARGPRFELRGQDGRLHLTGETRPTAGPSDGPPSASQGPPTRSS